ncbi:MAG: hypothetical protein JHD28_00145 [Bacteroidia bacterium]|nr:hypothetical protein [Bacteroidia bacterium]
MKVGIIFVFLVLNFSQIIAQKITSKVALAKNIELIAVIEKFDCSKHHYDTCRTDFGWKAICLIDGQIWFGNDQGLDLPKNKLLKLTIVINKKSIPLETNGMYNINYGSLTIREKQFKLTKTNVGFMLYGFFSDGAGTYTAHWQIIKNKANRNVLSNDENNFSWQLEN